MSKITKIVGREILDSRGIPTVESEVHLACGIVGLSSVPSGASTGSKEAIEVRDGDVSRFFGKGVTKSVNIINNLIAKSLIGKDVTKQFYLDQIMINLDGTENKSNLGSNSILSVSLSLAKAASLFKKMSLYEYISELYGSYGCFSMPLPMINIINGGKHADNNLDFQEFMIQPIGARNMRESIQMGSEIFQSLSNVLKGKNMSVNVGDEGGYAPNLKSHTHALDLIQESVESSGYIFGKDVTIAIDCASSEFFDRSQCIYFLKSEKRNFRSVEFIKYLESLVKNYPISSIEDGLSEFDWENCIELQNVLGKKIQLVGDDIFVTNPKILKKGIRMGILNAILVKFNQIGSLTETLSTISLAKKSNYKVIISHRSGETEDTTISDLAVGVSAEQIKTGSMSRSERVSKYNQLLRIEEKIGKNVRYSWR